MKTVIELNMVEANTNFQFLDKKVEYKKALFTIDSILCIKKTDTVPIENICSHFNQINKINNKNENITNSEKTFLAKRSKKSEFDITCDYKHDKTKHTNHSSDDDGSSSSDLKLFHLTIKITE